MKFLYKARDGRGTLITGELEGESAASVKTALAAQGLFPIAVHSRGWEFSWAWFRRSTRQKLLVDLTRQFQAMFSAGIPIDRIMTTLARQSSDRGLATALTRIGHDVSGGMKLSDAFARHPRYFGDLYVSMVAVGEAGGVLEKTIRELAVILKKDHRLRAQVKSATLYPKLVLLALVVVMTAMLAFVIPTFADFYAQYQAELPWPTRLLIGLSEMVTTWWYVSVALVVGGVIGWKKFSATVRGRAWIDHLVLRLPIVGPLQLMATTARFGHSLVALYRSGVPLSRALEIVAGTIENVHYAQDVRMLKHELDQGSPLVAAMQSAHHFPPLLQEAVAVGEQTGKLDELLESTAQFYDEEVDDLLKNMTTLIEPILLFVLFGVVALLSLAVYLPIWNMSRVVMPGG